VSAITDATAARVERLRATLAEPLLVTGPVNVAYLTGFTSSNAAALIEPERVRLFADSRYAEAGRAVPGVEFVESGRVVLADLAQRLEGRVAFEADHISYAGYETLGGGGLELVATRGLVEAQRALKDETEVDAIRRASLLADRSLEQLLTEDWVGRTEIELARRLRVLVLETGGDDVAFDVIVGSGPNGALPHARPGERRIKEGDAVVLDFGVLSSGYRSDVARTVHVGDVPAQLGDILEICLEAHLEAIARIVPGMTGIEADAVGRSVIEKAGYGDHFGHALGHGVGRDIHETPFLSKISTDTVEAGQIVTIEPGIYLPGLGGVRIEDLCIVREHGLESVTTLPKRVTLGPTR
jgi:Xaa-Pro aminopeptidase